jgi:hypothetical protein
MQWMPAYIAVQNLLSIISMVPSEMMRLGMDGADTLVQCILEWVDIATVARVPLKFVVKSRENDTKICLAK